MDRRSTFTIAKLHQDERLVFGYASVAVNADGQIVTDLQAHQIDPAELERAAYDFCLYFRESGEMHDGAPAVGALVESVVLTPEKVRAMFDDLVDATTLAVLEQNVGARWWVGFRLTPDAFAKVKDGTYAMFSIEGQAELASAA